jgi:glutamyl-tRNA synthetase
MSTAVADPPSAAEAVPAEEAGDDSWADVMRLVKSKGSMNVDLKDAEMGAVVTRFPPEPSGFLHIGHCKAAMLNDFFARKFAGKLILRFDDTNTDKSTQGFEDAILHDLELLGIKPDVVDYTSDFFPGLLESADRFIREGKAYVDCTPLEELRAQRMRREGNSYREAPVEENLRLWMEMVAGSEIGMTACLRAKIDMTSNNGSMRDPIMYRGKDMPHHRTGTTYKVYPTYDFSCPLVDSLEGVTHALRSLEYKDREEQYKWFCEAAGTRCPSVWEFSRLDFQRTVLSKRKLQKLVDIGAVDGWDDPRFPTVQGIRRRGMTVQGLRAFILSQGASRNSTLQGWDKIWTVNKRVIDPIAPRHVALETANLARMTIANAPEEIRVLPKHKKNPDVGMKNVIMSKQLVLEGGDAADLAVDQIVTLMDLGNVQITGVEDGGKRLTAIYLPDNKDYKKTAKLTWLADVPDLVPVKAVTYSDLLTKDKLDEVDSFEDFVNKDSVSSVLLSGDINLRALQKGDIIQLERRGYFICDTVHLRDDNAAHPLTLIEIPDGRVEQDYGNKDSAATAENGTSGSKEKKKKAKGGHTSVVKLPEYVAQFHMCDFRVGKIMTVGHHAEADGLYVLTIDCGGGEIRSVCAGLRNFVPESEMVPGRLMCLIANLKPRKVRGVDSAAMCLAGSVVGGEGEKEAVVPLAPPAGTEAGSIVYVEGMEGERGSFVDGKFLSSKNWDRVVARLSVKDGKACYDGQPLVVAGGGEIACSLPDGAEIH